MAKTPPEIRITNDTPTTEISILSNYEDLQFPTVEGIVKL